MTNKPAQTSQPQVKLERTYDADIKDLWELWATKEGFESWWGPEGFHVEVHEFDLRIGGTLYYDMIAHDPEQIAYMEKAGMATSHETRGVFVEIEPYKRLVISHMIDFIPGLEPYENTMSVEFIPEGERIRMLITIDPHPDAEWTRMATMGMESQLTKVPAALAERK